MLSERRPSGEGTLGSRDGRPSRASRRAAMEKGRRRVQCSAAACCAAECCAAERSAVPQAAAGRAARQSRAPAPAPPSRPGKGAAGD
jgi:hypothetical protein